MLINKIKQLDKIINRVYYKSSQDMTEIPNNSIDLIITSPPYFNIKDYSKDGKQNNTHAKKKKEQFEFRATLETF